MLYRFRFRLSRRNRKRDGILRKRIWKQKAPETDSERIRDGYDTKTDIGRNTIVAQYLDLYTNFLHRRKTLTWLFFSLVACVISPLVAWIPWPTTDNENHWLTVLFHTRAFLGYVSRKFPYLFFRNFLAVSVSAGNCSPVSFSVSV